ncbi:MAG: DUF2271 domain-containing protein [Verrucomicrobiota bacterium]
MPDPNKPSLSASLARAAAAGLTALAGAKPVLATSLPPSVGDDGPALAQAAALARFDFARDHVLGTSFDLAVDAVRPSDAASVEQAVLAEITRLNSLLSTYDPDSEISRVAAGAPVASSELAELLTAYATWSARTDGALDVRLAQVARLWREAAQTGRAPSPDALRAALTAPSALNVDALGKGYIIDRAVAVARRLAPAGLLNIGGDIRAWGDVDWLVGVADPRNPADNAPPLVSFLLRDAAVATSGGYARFTTVAGENVSHLIDPRTLSPAACLASATIIAADCLTANALSTAGCLLEAAHTLALATRHGSAGQLVITAGGGEFRAGLLATVASPTLSAPTIETKPAAPAMVTAPVTPAADKPAAAIAWPKNFRTTISLNIGVSAATSAPNGFGGPVGRGGPGGFGGRGGPGGFKRAYVAIWIEDAEHKLVRTLAVLGDNSRYVTELSSWYQAIGRPDLRSIRAITRATRPNGLFTIAWDGLSDKGQPVPQGTYTVRIEINREHGRRALLTALLPCDEQPHTIDLAASVESEASKIEYGPKATDAPDAPAPAPPLPALQGIPQAP